MRFPKLEPGSLRFVQGCKNFWFMSIMASAFLKVLDLHFLSGLYQS